MPPATEGPHSKFISVDAVDPAGGRDGDARTLVVHYTLATPCTPGLQRAEVEEGASSVAITLHRKPKRPGPEPICTQVVVKEKTTITLDEPLGDRTVVDGSRGREVPVRR